MEEKEKKEKNVVAPVEEKKNHKRRAILLLLLLLITGFLLTTSTYAWFTSNTTVSVTNINVNVSTGTGIQISANAIDWKSILSTSDLTGANTKYAAATNQMTGTLEPVSTGLTLDGDYLKMYHGIVDTNAGGDYILTTTDVSDVYDNSATLPEGVTNRGATGYFVAFDIFLKLDGTLDTSTDIYLTGAGSGVTATSDTGIKNASRVAFLVLGKELASETSSTVQAITGGANLAGDAVETYLWEPNYDDHTSTGVNNAENVYSISGLSVATGNTIVSYDGVNAEIDATDDIKLADATVSENASMFASVTPTYSTPTLFSAVGSTESLQIFDLVAGYVTKVRVYFWVEGQDVDCENGASGGNITLNLQFTTNTPE